MFNLRTQTRVKKQKKWRINLLKRIENACKIQRKLKQCQFYIFQKQCITDIFLRHLKIPKLSNYENRDLLIILYNTNRSSAKMTFTLNHADGTSLVKVNRLNL